MAHKTNGKLFNCIYVTPIKNSRCLFHKVKIAHYTRESSNYYVNLYKQALDDSIKEELPFNSFQHTKDLCGVDIC